MLRIDDPNVVSIQSCIVATTAVASLLKNADGEPTPGLAWNKASDREGGGRRDPGRRRPPTVWAQGSPGTEGLFVGVATARRDEVTTNNAWSEALPPEERHRALGYRSPFFEGYFSRGAGPLPTAPISGSSSGAGLCPLLPPPGTRGLPSTVPPSTPNITTSCLNYPASA